MGSKVMVIAPLASESASATACLRVSSPMTTESPAAVTIKPGVVKEVAAPSLL